MARFENLNVNKLNFVDTGAGNSGKSLFYIKGPNKSFTSGTVAATAVAGLSIPANTLVLGTYLTIVTAATETTTATVGDSVSAVGWVGTAANMTATAGTRYATSTGDTFAKGKLYSTNSTINGVFTCSSTATTASFRLEALCVRM